MLKRAGFHLYTEGSFPPGVNWLIDLKKDGLRTPATFFDIGANVGQTVSAIRNACPDARIFAFEPFLKTFETLKQEISQLSNVQVFQLAMGSSSGQLQVSTRENSLFNSLVRAELPTNQSQSDTSNLEAITVDTLDHFCTIYETYPFHHFPEPNVFCNALFVHRTHRLTI